MSDFESSTSGRGRRTLFLSLIVILGLAPGAWYLWPRFEREAPQVRLSPDSDALGLAPIEIVLSDRGAGLRCIPLPYKHAASAMVRPLIAPGPVVPAARPVLSSDFSGNRRALADCRPGSGCARARSAPIAARDRTAEQHRIVGLVVERQTRMSKRAPWPGECATQRPGFVFAPSGLWL